MIDSQQPSPTSRTGQNDLPAQVRQAANQTGSRVLVVDDDPQIVRALGITLRARGYQVTTAADGRSALAAAADTVPDLVVLDLGLPDLDGTEVITALRGWCPAPILVLSGRSDSAEKVAALDAGADDYVTKPFAVDELLARLRAVTRRAPNHPVEPVVAVGHLLVDLAATTIRPATDSGEEGPKLTPTEWRLLRVLLAHPGRLLTKRQLLAEVWGPGYLDDDGNLRLYMARLRKKLEPDPARPRHLLTDPGLGYRFSP